MSRVNLGVNLEDIESGYAVVPEGTYRVRIKETSKLGISNSSKQPLIRWSYEILEPEEFVGKTIPDSTSLQDQALFRLKQIVEAAGIEYDEAGFELEDTFGLEMIVEVTVGEYDGKPQNKISKYMACNAGTPNVSAKS